MTERDDYPRCMPKAAPPKLPRLSSGLFKMHTKSNKSFAAAYETNVEELLRAEDLGVAFFTRAATVDGNTQTKSEQQEPYRHMMPNRALSRWFVEDENGQEERKKEKKKIRWRAFTRFAGTSKVAHRTERALKCSGLISCIYIFWVLGVEPACIPPEPGSIFHCFEGWLAILHSINAFFYAALALPSRAFFSRVDLQRGEELTRPKDIWCSHLRSPGLWFDVVALFGWLAEMLHMIIEGPRGGTPSGMMWAMVLQLGKIWRVVLPEGLPSAERNSFVQGVMRLFLSLACFAHVMASLLLILGHQESSWGGSSWLDGIDYGDAVNCPVLYTEALYFAVLSLTSVGYGDILLTPLERATNTCFLLLAQLFTAKVCADLTWLTSAHNHWEAQHQALRTQTWVALQRMNVPRVLAKRVLAFQNYVATVHREDLEQPAFAGLSSNLIKELRLCVYQKLVIQAPFLREQPKEVISLIVASLSDSIFLPADMVVRAGEQGRELFFMRRGECAVFVGADAPCWGSSPEVATYTTGNYFGELGMLTGRPRAAWIMAKTYCICSVLPYSAVETLSAEYPGAFTTLVQSMVNTFQLKSTFRWDNISGLLERKCSFKNIGEAFMWFKSKSESPDDEELTAKGFDKALHLLKVPELDRKILWAEMDADNSGSVSIEEFACKLTVGGESAPTASMPESSGMQAKPVSGSFSRQASFHTLPLDGVSTEDLLLEIKRRTDLRNPTRISTTYSWLNVPMTDLK